MILGTAMLYLLKSSAHELVIISPHAPALVQFGRDRSRRVVPKRRQRCRGLEAVASLELKEGGVRI